MQTMAPCEGNCVYGDAGPYDGTKCGCVQCPFYIACKSRQPPWVLKCHEGMCPDCAIVGPPTIINKSGVCKVCKESKDVFIKPAGWRGRKHFPCANCYRAYVRFQYAAGP